MDSRTVIDETNNSDCEIMSESEVATSRKQNKAKAKKASKPPRAPTDVPASSVNKSRKRSPWWSHYVVDEEVPDVPECNYCHAMIGCAKVEMDIEQLMTKHFEMDMGSSEANLNKTELDKYLGEDREAIDVNFDILKWWGINKCRYPVLSKMARDILAIPVSTVASESAFSTGGRVLDSFRTSLTPRMVEALVCTQDWVRDCHDPINVDEILLEIEKLEEEGLKDLTVDQPTIIIDETVDELADNIRGITYINDFYHFIPSTTIHTYPVLQIVGARLLPFTPILIRSESRSKASKSLLADLTTRNFLCDMLGLFDPFEGMSNVKFDRGC
ncbi:hypothetical protein LXL04_018047 [Taraxacum kok-saghyz]